ncbi:uncharacterized protein FA14DRAFT_162573 [Meira miltonrushii]|uniref:Uncharacterized protein n=1 Tax=Meira miltonrushii TaxID=1280837 RepID=A0A316V224_9BASI|nr:uncharacterized protein FA14DRAFT_162573 [Meira miltonrushii]PWN31596.1 hypothetical protein FA14DRAFT_162573 [Meira miltonrushii]
MLQAQYNQHNNILAQHHQFHETAMATQFNAPPSYDEAALEKDFSQFKLNEKKRQEYFNKAQYTPVQPIAGSSRLQSIPSNTSAWMKMPNGSNAPPIVIPQTSAKMLQKNLAPFSRAYPTQLAQYGIRKEEFIKIIDELNECFILNPAFQIMRMAGMAVGCVPSPTLIGIGAGLQVAAGLGGAGMTYMRTKAFVKKMNKNLFDQHGLQMRIFSTEKMMKAIGEPEGERRLNLAPLPEFDGEWDPTSPETDPRLRRMTALKGRVGELDWNVPEPVMSKNVLKKMGDWQAQKQAKSVQKRHEKMCSKVNKYQNATTHKERQKGARKVEKLEKREGKTTQRIRWICIVPKSQSELIDDESEDAESESDYCEKK